MIKELIIRKYSDIWNQSGLIIPIPNEGQTYVISGRNGTGKTSALSLILAPFTKKGFGATVKDNSENVLAGMDISYKFTTGDELIVERKKGGKDDRFDYSFRTVGGAVNAITSTDWHSKVKTLPSGELISITNSSRTVDINETEAKALQHGYKKDELGSELIKHVEQIFGPELGKINVLRPKKGLSHRKILKDGKKTKDRFFFGKRSISDIFLRLLLSDRGSVILIDEIELGLHFNLHEKALLQINTIAQDRGLRIILTTHSPYCFNKSNLMNRYLLKKNEIGEVIIEQSATLNSFDELSGDPSKTIYIAEDSIGRLFLEAEIGKTIKAIEGGGYLNCLALAQNLRKLYPKDSFITVLDPDSSDTGGPIFKTIAKSPYLNDFNDTSKTKALSTDGKVCPEALLIKFLFEDNQKVLKSFANADEMTVESSIVELLKNAENDDLGIKKGQLPRKPQFEEFISSLDYSKMNSATIKNFYKRVSETLSSLNGKSIDINNNDIVSHYMKTRTTA